MNQRVCTLHLKVFTQCMNVICSLAHVYTKLKVLYKNNLFMIFIRQSLFLKIEYKINFSNLYLFNDVQGLKSYFFLSRLLYLLPPYTKYLILVFERLVNSFENMCHTCLSKCEINLKNKNH